MYSFANSNILSAFANSPVELTIFLTLYSLSRKLLLIDSRMIK